MTLPVRVSARAIIVDPDDRILLMEIEPNFVVDPKRSQAGAYWITPGGGVRDGEEIDAAIARELREETGFSDLAVGAPIHTIEQELLWKDVLTLVRDHYFLIRVRDKVIATDLMEEEERSIFRRYHWWPVASLGEEAFDLRPVALKGLIPTWL